MDRRPSNATAGRLPRRGVARPGRCWPSCCWPTARPPGRRQLAELLFGEAADPLGALRWTLAELRRALGAPGLFAGDPVATTLEPGVEVDLQALADQPADPAPLLGLAASSWRA